jgi:hypothetical protein
MGKTLKNMKSQDLRIGNYLYYEHTTHIVSGIHGNKVYSWWVKDGEPVIEYEAKDISGTQVENPYIDVISQYEPIPLTEEWLIKLGFEKLTDSKDGFKNTTYTYTKGISFIVYFDGVRLSTNFWMGNEKHYIHQLQNLFYVLSGEELTIKQD